MRATVRREYDGGLDSAIVCVVDFVEIDYSMNIHTIKAILVFEGDLEGFKAHCCKGKEGVSAVTQQLSDVISGDIRWPNGMDRVH
jgi:hypothetical protein